jgi:HAD superfamily hydrolase (TIGR01509 family)
VIGRRPATRAPAIALFDLGDVVARWDPAPRLAEYARRSGLTPDEVRARLATDRFWQNTDLGRYSADEMEARICELLGCRIARAELLRLQAAAFAVRPEVLRIAERAASHSRVGILTNNAPLLREAVPVHLPELVRVFDPILYSFEFGATKPARELFERVTSRLGLPAGEIFFTDDQETHVAAARAAGWRAVRFESAAQLEKSLGWLAESASH